MTGQARTQLTRTLTLRMAVMLGTPARAQNGPKRCASTCAGCYGDKGEGLIIVPALAGHFAEILKAQGWPIPCMLSATVCPASSRPTACSTTVEWTNIPT